jgi:histidine ammonia-lyase
MKRQAIVIDGNSLTLDTFDSVVRENCGVILAESARAACTRSHDDVAGLVAGKNPVYGVNTGYGIFSDTRVDEHQASELSDNLILSHAVGYGPPFPPEVTRGAMLIRANTLARGYSGVNPLIVETLLSMVNSSVIPLVPSHGSLGASGDLAPLAHVSLVLADLPAQDSTDVSGQVWYQDKILTGKEAMKASGIQRVRLGPKDGLALTNGAAFSTSLLVLACLDAERALLTSELALSTTMEALLGVSSAFDQRLHGVRPHPGQVAVAARIRDHIQGSSLVDSDERVQDAYSLRCGPQIIGPAWDILEYASSVSTREMNSSTDNPLIFDREVLSGGNFHGGIIGQAADFLKIALSEVASLSERRIFRLTSSHTNMGLPPMLVADSDAAGMYSGLMMLQYTAASLVLEIQHLALPDSLHSIPTSGGQEDHNPNSTTAGRNLSKLLELFYAVLAIELICACQGIDIRTRRSPGSRPGKNTSRVYEAMRELVTFVETDRPLWAEIQDCQTLLRQGHLLKAIT